MRAAVRQDVFLSYAHVDNWPDLPNQTGWVSIFQDALRKRLSKELGRPANVWWDQRELRGDQQFDDVIREACDASTVMVAVVSPRYVDSDSCRRELEYFTLREQAPELNSKRLFIVKAMLFDPAALDAAARPALHKAVTKTLGYAFTYEDESTNRYLQLHTYDPTLCPIYHRRLEELAQDIAEEIRRVEGHTGASRVPPRASGPVPRAAVRKATDQAQAIPPVFFAATSSDVAHVRDAMRAELVDRGIAVYAPTVWSDDYATMRGQLLQALAKTSLAVQVVGAEYGSRPEGTEKSVPELQFDLLEEVGRSRAANAPLIRLVWLSSSAEPKSEKQKAFVERLLTYEGWGQSDEFLTGTREELAERIMTKWQALEKERQAEEARRREQEKRRILGAQDAVDAGREIHRIYVISADRDHERARAVEDALQLPDWEILSSAEVSADSADPEERERQHQEYLTRSDAFIIYHGDAQFRWVRAQADAARKVNGLRGVKYLGSLYVARPMEGRKATYQLIGIQRIDDVADDIALNLEPLLQRLAAMYTTDVDRNKAGGTP